MSKDKDTFVMRKDWYSKIRECTEPEKAWLLDAIYEYQVNKTITKSGERYTDAIIEDMRKFFDYSAEKYEKTRIRNGLNQEKRWADQRNDEKKLAELEEKKAFLQDHTTDEYTAVYERMHPNTYIDIDSVSDSDFDFVNDSEIENDSDNEPPDAAVSSSISADKTIDPEIISLEDAWFNEFWASYPKQTGEKEARKQFKAICRTEKDFTAIMDGLRKYRKNKADGKYLHNPVNWLKGEHWKDNDRPAINDAGNVYSNADKIAAFMDVIEQEKRE